MHYTKALAAMAMSAVFGSVSAQASSPALSPEQMTMLQKEASLERAVALGKLVFMSEYCAHVSNNAPAHVPAYKVEVSRDEVGGLPENIRAYIYDYAGTKPSGGQVTPEYCGGLTIAGPANDVMKKQVDAFEVLTRETRKLAQGYAASMLKGTGTDEQLVDAYMGLRTVCAVFQKTVFDSMLTEPFRADGRPNLIGVAVRPPRPTKAGDEQVNQILDDNLESLRADLERVIDANPPGGPRQVPHPSGRPGMNLHNVGF